DVRALGFSTAQARGTALCVPQYGPIGKPNGVCIRQDDPRLRYGKPIRYELPAGASSVLDVHPSQVDAIADPRRVLVICEGIKKADAAVSRGITAISIPGVWGWKGPNQQGGAGTVLPDWEEIPLR